MSGQFCPPRHTAGGQRKKRGTKVPRFFIGLGVHDFHAEAHHHGSNLRADYNGPLVKTTFEKNIVNYGALNSSGAYVRYAALVAAKLAAYTSSGVA